MTDTYATFAALTAVETLGEDYRIRCYDRDPRWAVIAIHAGGIETGTSELCRSIAGEDQPGQWWSEYRFEGIKSSGNSVLHITSTNFDEPTALNLVERHLNVLSLHGTAGQDPVTYIGGLDTHTGEWIAAALVLAGFDVDQSPPPELAGTDPDNICNQGLLGKGIQLEITTAQRAAFFDTNTASQRWNTRNATFATYAAAIRGVLNGTVEAG